jgi:hypothetical protein
VAHSLAILETDFREIGDNIVRLKLWPALLSGAERKYPSSRRQGGGGWGTPLKKRSATRTFVQTKKDSNLESTISVDRVEWPGRSIAKATKAAGEEQQQKNQKKSIDTHKQIAHCPLAASTQTKLIGSLGCRKRVEVL